MSSTSSDICILLISPLAEPRRELSRTPVEANILKQANYQTFCKYAHYPEQAFVKRYSFLNFTNPIFRAMRKLSFVLLFGLLFSGCRHEDTYPDIPALEFKNLTFSNVGPAMTFKLTTTFTDGDGDVGYFLDRPNESDFDDSLSDYYYNYVIELQVQSGGEWKDSIISYTDIDLSDTTDVDGDTTITFYNDLASARIPYLTPEGQNKGLKGDIDKTAFLPYILVDTIRFRVFIYDRERHKSNVIYTPGYFVNYQ